MAGVKKGEKLLPKALEKTGIARLDFRGLDSPSSVIIVTQSFYLTASPPISNKTF
jgi:hypothetical protein